MLVLNNLQFNNLAFTAVICKNHNFGTEIFDKSGKYDRYELTNSQGILKDLEE